MMIYRDKYEDTPGLYDDTPEMYDGKSDLKDVMTDLYDIIKDIYDDMADLFAYPWHVWMLVLWGVPKTRIWALVLDKSDAFSN